MRLDAEALNADCACISLDRDALCRALSAEVGDPEFCRALAVSHPTLISTLPVFVKPGHLQAMQDAITAIERVARLPAYREAALAQAPAICRNEPGAVGVFMGYDFHLGPGGPKLIEINTNAGGVLVNAFVARAQKACCGPMESLFPRQMSDGPELGRLVEVFRAEFARQKGTGARLGQLAIVDDSPEQQYLYPEFVLFRHLFDHHGIDAVVASADELEHRDGGLWHRQRRIDLVYNRLTDFALEEPGHAALRTAYLARDVVVTPNPWAHALLADKRNLVRLSDPSLLSGWGVDAEAVDLLARTIPRTILVASSDGEALWKERGRYFFKPASGHGSKAAYRGDKITRRVWQTILSGPYVAQEVAAPGLRTVVVDGERRQLKVDVRCYTYDGKVLLSAARLYQGQTTNFRTPGGGFAPVLAGLG
jgi:hypothetical protein